MPNGSTHISTTRPDPPGDADFALYIDFKRGSGNPARVFQAAEAMIRAFQRLSGTAKHQYRRGSMMQIGSGNSKIEKLM